MPNPIVHCQCGANIRVPAEAVGRAIRCPKCKSRLEVSTEPAAPVTTRALDTGDSVECPICQTRVHTGEPAIVCDRCDQLHHQDCWNEVGGCSTYGCENAPAADVEKTSNTPLSAWGDTKKCPACGESIKAIAVRCRYCDTEFDSVDPLSIADLRKQATRQAGTDSSKKGTVAIFIFSILGVLAPLMLMISLVYMLRKRAHLAKAGPLFVIMGWTSVGLSALYSLLILLFLIAGD